jgi:putative transposase
MSAVTQLTPAVGIKTACDVLAVPRSRYYRQHGGGQAKEPAIAARRRPANPRRYSDAERAQMRAVLNSERFMDQSPEQVVAVLAEEGTYLASARTLYRVLAEAGQLRERRARRQHPKHATPRLVARGPNEIWSWDITKLKGPEKGIYYMLYVVLDIFSRYVVGWLLAERENAQLAQHLLRQSMYKQGVIDENLTVHADRGSPMRALSTRQMLDSLGATASYSRPRVSNDNPYSESQFGTLKARPELPERLGSVTHGRQILRPIFNWYNTQHHHSGIAMLTPQQVHSALAEQVLRQRLDVRMAAYRAHPERFIGGPPRLESLPPEVWINQPKSTPENTENGDCSALAEGGNEVPLLQ